MDGFSLSPHDNERPPFSPSPSSSTTAGAVGNCVDSSVLERLSTAGGGSYEEGCSTPSTNSSANSSRAAPDLGAMKSDNSSTITPNLYRTCNPTSLLNRPLDPPRRRHSVQESRSMEHDVPPTTAVSFHSSTKRNSDDDPNRRSSDSRSYRPRLDSHGRPIQRGGKKHSIAFIDEIKSSEKIEKVYEVESYKGTAAHRKSSSCLSRCTIM